MPGNVKFIRKNGKIIPIKDKKSRGSGSRQSKAMGKNEVHRRTLNQVHKESSVASKFASTLGWATLGSLAGGAAGFLAAAPMPKGKLGAATVVAGYGLGAIAGGRFGYKTAGLNEKSYMKARSKAKRKNKTGLG
jgi:hypothetical protein